MQSTTVLISYIFSLLYRWQSIVTGTANTICLPLPILCCLPFFFKKNTYIFSRHHWMLRLQTRPSAMREVVVDVPDVRWEDIGGNSDIKQSLREAVEWPLLYSDAFARLSIRFVLSQPTFPQPCFIYSNY